MTYYKLTSLYFKECVLMHCGQHSETITLHDICQKKMARDINLFECFKSVHITRYTHEKTFASQCPLVKHILTEIYTGTCPKAGMGPLKSSMISTGAAAGAAVGTIVPVVSITRFSGWQAVRNVPRRYFSEHSFFTGAYLPK